MINDIFNILLPQLVLGGFIILLLVLGMVFSPRLYKYARIIAAIGISLSVVFLSTVQTEPQCFGFRNSVMSDSYTLLFDFMILGCGFLVTLLSKNLVKSSKRNAYTFFAILLTAIFGAMNVVSANDFLTLLVSVELLGFSTYFLISVSKGYRSKEAAFKYLITSAVSTGIFLFGVSYLYGIVGSLNFTKIYEYITQNNTSLVYTVSAIMIILGLASKLSIFPFANWVIDVYKGTETSILAYLSTIPKLAMFGIICRLLVFPLSNSVETVFVISLLSVLTALWANTYAIREKNVKVILACSSSANASYALLTAASPVSVYNLSAVVFYLICYVIMNIGVFAYLNMYGDEKSFDVNAFRGIFHKNYGFTALYAILIIGLAGIPITSGFVAKIYLFTAIASSGLIYVPFLLALLLLMVVALFYYLKILLPLFDTYDKNNEAEKLRMNFSQQFVIVVSALITLLLGVCPEMLIELCKFIAYNI